MSDCVSAHDLHDLAPERLGDQAEAWRTQCMDFSAGQCYWIGQAEPLYFPWGQPAHNFPNPVTRSIEPGWRIPSEGVCCVGPSLADLPARVQLQPETDGAYVPTDHVIYGRVDEAIILADAVHQRFLALEGVAAAMWEALMDEADIDVLMARLLAQYDVAAVTHRRDLRQFTTDLLAHGFLRPSVTSPQQ